MPDAGQGRPSGRSQMVPDWFIVQAMPPHGTNMDRRDDVIAIALLTQTDLERLGKTFTRFCPLDESPAFDELLKAIDGADEAWWRRQAE